MKRFALSAGAALALCSTAAFAQPVDPPRAEPAVPAVPATSSELASPAMPATPATPAEPPQVIQANPVGEGAHTPPPVEAMAKDYPVCSATVTDSCINRADAPKARHGRRRM